MGPWLSGQIKLKLNLEKLTVRLGLTIIMSNISSGTAWLLQIKLANFSWFFCPSIPKRDLETKETTPTIEVWPESLGTKLEYWYIERGLYLELYTMVHFRVPFSFSFKTSLYCETIYLEPSSERIEELWVECDLYTKYGATLLVGAW